MQSIVLKKRIGEFLTTEKSGDCKSAGKVFIDNLAKFILDIVFEEVKLTKDAIPMSLTLPEADVATSGLKHNVGEVVYYVIFKQVRSQVKGRLTVTYGWQFAVMRGKIEEISIRSDHGILCKVNGDSILQDLVFKTEAEALVKCTQLNSGTVACGIEEDKNKHVYEKCADCGCDVDLKGKWYQDDVTLTGVLCESCYEKRKGGVADGETEEIGASGGDGCESVGATSERETN